MTEQRLTAPCPHCERPAYYATGLVAKDWSGKCEMKITGPARCLNHDCSHYGKVVAR